MREALETVDGVLEAQVSFDLQRARTLAQGNTCSPAGQARLVQAVEGAKFGCRVVQVRRAASSR